MGRRLIHSSYPPFGTHLLFLNVLPVLVVLVVAQFVSAQKNSTYIDPNSIDPSVRSSWCTSQLYICGNLCSGTTIVNKCDPVYLKWLCVCGNVSIASVALYKNSLPWHICDQSYNACMEGTNSNDVVAQASCWTNIGSQCGTLDVANFVGNKTPSISISLPKLTAVLVSTSTTSLTSLKPLKSLSLPLTQSLGSTSTSNSALPTSPGDPKLPKYSSDSALSAATEGQPSHTDGTMTPAAKAGISIVAGCIFSVVGLLTFWVLRRRRRSKPPTIPDGIPELYGDSRAEQAINARFELGKGIHMVGTRSELDAAMPVAVQKYELPTPEVHHEIDISAITARRKSSRKKLSVSAVPSQRTYFSEELTPSWSGSPGPSSYNHFQQPDETRNDPELVRLEELERMLDSAILESERIRNLKLEKAGLQAKIMEQKRLAKGDRSGAWM